MIIEGLPTHLRNNAGVSELVAERIFPQVIPQHDYRETSKQPCITYQLVSAIRQPLFCGTDELIQQSVQIDCYAPSYLQVHQVANAVRAALVDFGGQMGSVVVKNVILDSDFDGVDEEPGLFRFTQLYSVWFVET